MSLYPTRFPGTLRRLALACALGGAGLAPAVALADSPPLALDLPSQSLEATVHALAHESGVAIAADSRVLAGRSAPALRGRYTVLQALQQLLQGSDLVAVEENGVVILRSSSEAGALTLGATTVNASGFASDLPDAYSGGQVARGARVGLLGNRDIMDTPFNITAYTAQAIENQQSGTVGAVLRNDPSIRFSTGEGHAYENFMIRGYSLDSTELAVNGLYGLAPDGHVPTEFLERVEVLKGPGALLSGMAPNGGVGGVINLVPKRAGDAPLTRLTTSYVSDGFVAEHIDLSRRFADGRFGIRFNGVYGSGDTGVDQQSKDRTLASLALDYRGDDFKLELDAYETHEKLDNGSPMMAGFSKLGQVTKAPKPDTNILEGIHAKQISKAVVLHGEYELDEHWTAFASVGGARTRYDGFLNGTRVIVTKADGTATGETYNQAGYTHSLSTEAGLRGNFMTGDVSHQLVLSATLLHQDIGRAPTVTGPKYTTSIYHPGKAVIAGDHGSSDKTGDNTLSSFALADTLGFVDDRVLLTLGVRAQRVRQKMSNPAYDERKLTPALGIVVKPWDAPVSLYANYIEGLTQGGMVTDLKAANYGEQFAPYVARQMETGVKWDLGDFSHTLAVFQIEKPSMIKDGGADEYRYTDDGEQRNRGVEWNMFGEVVPGVRLLGGVTYTRARLTKTANGQLDGNTARGVPQWSANLGAEWDLPWVEGLTLTALGIHSSSQYLDDENTLKIPQWTRYDLGARYATKVLSKDVTLRASLENVENRAYWAGVFNPGYATVSEPRTLKLSASVDF
ncbi:TonB-dependent receptor [Pseudomonas guariconensis]|uniref:TonB-dependent receptor n=1 Tax=Pseudomonas TaxID=286 RepID=UPI002097300C|nr:MULTISPECIES: TonB-dependent receptor [Pseudomonas]MCO7635461.1 TonB-dependent receptor [Pseudomonas sp. S 311-6]MCO7514637.1 TonB-dependent receptor [Pseudomonas putida]MCO7566313.1 TonB-dependent receptor [Pseudomonas mosselii]MCO7604690.1 TonB-dependent receptor [Pseudomonas guariconensis]MCO7617371.1 TonB-dependent receptor [Pseudomonas guariconensis]